MLQIIRMNSDPRFNVLVDDSLALVTIVQQSKKIILEMPATAAAQLRAMLPSGKVSHITNPPSPPRYKWRQLLQRLDRDALTPSDMDALRDLLFHLGVQ